MAILSKYEKMTEELLNKRKALLDERNRERERGSKGIEESATKLTEINKKLEGSLYILCCRFWFCLEVNLKTRPLPRVVEPSPPVPSLPIYFGIIPYLIHFTFTLMGLRWPNSNPGCYHNSCNNFYLANRLHHRYFVPILRDNLFTLP